jgi:diguanylate cyclase (GGDEF)-like protein/PAS domain S-box-containing protein
VDQVNERVLISLCPDPVIGVDGKGVVQIFNAAAEKLLGYSSDDIIGKLHIKSIYPDLKAAQRIKRLLYSDLQGAYGSVEGYEATLLTVDGNEVPVRLSAALIDQSEGSSIGFFHDLTERRTLEKQLHKLSVTDELTGLYNQRHFYKVLAKELNRAKRYGRPLSLICFDLDNFKKINDSLGHLEGDRILKTIGGLLDKALRLSDVGVRYGGDEFMVILPDTDIEAAAKTAERIRYLFNKTSEFSIEQADSEDERCVSMSLGVTETNGSEKSDHLVQRADLAMYEAKSSGGNRTVLIKQQMGNRVGATGS